MGVSFRHWPGRLVARPWLLAFLPINAATAGFGVVLPLLILIPLHGNWADVAIAATLYNSTLILSSVLWGHLSDRYPLRRHFLVLNYAGFAGLYALMIHVGSLPELYGLYAVIGAIAPAGASASNLLILEKFTEGERATAFASFQEVSMIGCLVGLLAGYFWTAGNAGLLALLAVFAALALASAIAVALGISEARRRLTTASVARHPESLLSRLRPATPAHTPVPFFPRRPRLRPEPWGRLRRWAAEELHHELPLIMIASFLFNLSANLFNISYTPYLYSIGLTAASIFLVNLSNNLAQAIVFPLTGGLSNRLGVDRLVHSATYVRGVGYLATAGLTFVVLTRTGGFGANVAIYALLGGAIAVYTTASTLILFRGVAGREAGSLLGVNSALGGGAAVVGAGLAGILAVVGSFRLVFLVASGILFASLPLWTAASIAYRRRRPAEVPTPASSERGTPGTVAEPIVSAKTH
ncbi:MAG TPA: MFS transporter [Thermoplasmata archaeon]|nr:MFS transporter [Thermoplasmata archaeon]